MRTKRNLKTPVTTSAKTIRLPIHKAFWPTKPKYHASLHVLYFYVVSTVHFIPYACHDAIIVATSSQTPILRNPSPRRMMTLFNYCVLCANCRWSMIVVHTVVRQMTPGTTFFPTPKCAPEHAHRALMAGRDSRAQ
jgi:hypothetical protein